MYYVLLTETIIKLIVFLLVLKYINDFFNIFY